MHMDVCVFHGSALLRATNTMLSARLTKDD